MHRVITSALELQSKEYDIQVCAQPGMQHSSHMPRGCVGGHCSVASAVSHIGWYAHGDPRRGPVPNVLRAAAWRELTRVAEGASNPAHRRAEGSGTACALELLERHAVCRAGDERGPHSIKGTLR